VYFNFYSLDNLLNNYEICFWKCGFFWVFFFYGYLQCQLDDWNKRRGSFNRSLRRCNGIINPDISDEGLLVLGIQTAFWWWSYGGKLLACLGKDFCLSLLPFFFLSFSTPITKLVYIIVLGLWTWSLFKRIVYSKELACGCPHTTDFGQKNCIFMLCHVCRNLAHLKTKFHLTSYKQHQNACLMFHHTFWVFSPSNVFVWC
jgi:hypothetical protein